MSDIKRVIILGAGGVGFHLAVALCRDFPGTEISVYDPDDFNGGMGHFRLPKVSNPSTKKVALLKGHIIMVMGDRPPKVFDRRFEVSDVQALPNPSQTLVVDATDMGLGERRPLWTALKQAGVKMLRISYDGNGCVVVARGLPLCASDAGGYAMVPTYAQSLMAGGLGAEAVGLLLQGYAVNDYQIQLPRGVHSVQTNRG